MRDNNIIGIDLAKKIMHIVEIDSNGKKVKRQKSSRDEFLKSLAEFDKSSIVSMEACGGCNYWSQQISSLGFTVKLLKTKDVQVYAKSKQKNDFNDALAIAKAAKDPELQSVRAKSKEQQDVSFLHKTRSNTIRDRVQKTNSMMSSLFEYGYVSSLSKRQLCAECEHEVIKAHKEGYISEQVYDILVMECKEIEKLCEKEKSLDKKIITLNQKSDKAIKLYKIMGIGAINASILSIAPMESYSNPRDFAASLGLVPKQYTSGDKISLGSITKQGDRYARTMLIQGARTIAIRARNVKEPQDRLLKWAHKKLAEGKPFNVVAVGLANKLARIAYSVIVKNTEYTAV